MKERLKTLAIIFVIAFVAMVIDLTLHAQEPEKERTVYKYKKYEKFDFDELKIDGETGTPGDLSIMHRFQTRYQNKLPYRKNFNAEIRKAIGRIR